MIISFDKFEEKQKELESYKKSILKLIDEFITTDAEFNNSRSVDSRYRGSSDFFIDPKWGFTVVYSYGDNYVYRTDHLNFNGLEYKRLQEFMKNPELYKNMKKYNI